MDGSVYERLQMLILNNSFDRSQSLGEVGLAQLLGVSRTPVREALKRLEHEGLVERYGRGLRVKERSPEEILDIYQVMISLETTAAGGAAERATQLDLSRLEAIHREMEALAADDLAEHVSWDSVFHEALWHASRNLILTDFAEKLSRQLRRYPHTQTVPHRWQDILSEHRKLIDAVRARDGERAEEVARQHMSVARDMRLRMYATDLTNLTGPGRLVPK